jgi:UDP-N-acetylmuramoylalanine--D-glutamate ligase
MDVNGKQVVVLGLGISGMEAATLLQDKGAHVTVRDNASGNATVDGRAATLRQRGITVELGKEIAATGRFDLGVLSPGINPTAPLVKGLTDFSVPLLSELELAFRFCQCPIVAITGTNGKTTTTELVYAVLAAGGKRTSASGNIGTAFSAAVRESGNLDVMVLEVSSFQLEQIAEFRPYVSVHLNLTPDHLDRYKSMQEYEAAKWQIFRNQTADDYAIVNANLRLPEIKAHKITLSSIGAVADYQLIDGWLVAMGRRVLEQSRTNLIGPHNAENMLAALAVADLYEIPREAAIEALCAYKPLPHRLEKVGLINGVTFINDSKATNIDALEKALLAMRSPVVLLAGGKDKGLDFSGLTSLVKEKAKAVVLIGNMTEKLFALWSNTLPCRRAATLSDAVDQSQALAESGETVLFSPGCSSFDMFRDYEDRGNQFRALVQAKAKANS